MKTYEIYGHVIDRRTQRGVEGLRVEAWDEDMIVDDLLGSTRTKSDGSFHIRFDESYYKELFLDLRPDIYFKVFKGRRLIADTSDDVIWNVDREGITTTIEIDEDEVAGVVESSHAPTSRNLLQATYISLKDDQGVNTNLKRGVEKSAFIRAIHPTNPELKELLENIKSEKPNEPSLEKYTKAVENIKLALTDRRTSRAAQLLAAIDSETIIDLAERLYNLRKTHIHEFSNSILTTKTKRAKKKELQLTDDPHLEETMEWVSEEEIDPDWVHNILESIKSPSLPMREISLKSFEQKAAKKLEKFDHLLRGFKDKTRSDVLPVGYLHLEKLGFTPIGVEKGELSYSVPLAPGEEVNITHREWAHSEEGYEKIVTDYFEEYSEEGVTEKTELSQTVNSQRKHDSAFNTNVTAAYSYSGAYGDIKVSNSLGYNVSESATRSSELSRNKSADMTAKASSRAKREHKMSFKVASAGETEDQTVRRIKNPFEDRATRVDYYQLMRKWQIDLFRYGIRLTYDIVVSEPGKSLLHKMQEIQKAYEALEEGLNFTLTPGELTVDNFIDKALEYGVQITDAETPEPKPVLISDFHDWETEGVMCHGPAVLAYTVPVEIPEGYKVKDVAYFSYDLEKCKHHPHGWDMKVMDQSGKTEAYLFRFGHEHHEPGNEEHPEVQVREYDAWENSSGQKILWLRAWRIKNFNMTGSIEVVPNEATIKNWQQKTWKAIRDGAESVYYESRQRLKEKIDRLEEELAYEDSLSLRKKEREEIMKAVLETMGFPPEQFNDDPEVIKFVHHAIEWENMLYFLYPYFWSDPSQNNGHWEFKRSLKHPDAMHNAFLKSGSSRVVLTIRPGFEKSFLAFMDTGQLDQIPEHPYFTIAEEFESYAKTSYPGIPMANPDINYRPLLQPRQIQTWKDMELIMSSLEEYRRRPYPSQRQAWRDMKKLMQFLKDYYTANNNTYPNDLDELVQYFPNESVPTNDPWGNPYNYLIPGVHGDYDLSSYGANGRSGGEGEDMDIVIWREDVVQDYPASLQVLRDNFSGEVNIPLVDRWGNNFDYQYPGIYSDYDLVSFGANGMPGGDGENTDLASWAEASLIGRWYEYTPTSALDIAFDENIPER